MYILLCDFSLASLHIHWTLTFQKQSGNYSRRLNCERSLYTPICIVCVLSMCVTWCRCEREVREWDSLMEVKKRESQEATQ